VDRFDSLRLFVRIVELGSFTRAASELGIPRATATHAIKALETRLGARLLDRTTRQVNTTLDGQAYYDRCARLLVELEEVEASLTQVAEDPRGIVRIDLPSLHIAHVLLPRISEFRRRYPRIELVVTSAGGRTAEMIRDGTDCVVRSGSLNDATLISRHLTALPQIICASPEYLRHNGWPRHPDELIRHQAVGCIPRSNDLARPFLLFVDGERHEYRLHTPVSVDDAQAHISCALRGCGLVQLPRFQVEPHLRSGDLVQVLDDWHSPDLPLSLLHSNARHLPSRVRVFAEWLVSAYTSMFGPVAAQPG
jgi:LysR family transcriptional regulator, regulator for bpeEF and oprC